jgi:hypothetical protein
MRLNDRLTQTVRDLVDEVLFRFPVDCKEAQRLIADALVRQQTVELVVRIIDTTLLDDGQDTKRRAS